jgi:adenosylhomocysteine nucleosidase
MKIGLVGAMQEEIRLLLNDMHDARQDTRAMRDYWRGTLYGKDTTLVFSRWGKVAAASTVTTLLAAFGVDVVVFTGVAGAVSPISMSAMS